MAAMAVPLSTICRSRDFSSTIRAWYFTLAAVGATLASRVR